MTCTYLDPEFEGLRPEQVELIDLENKPPLHQVAEVVLSPREYQYEIFKKAAYGNTIAVLDTGAGKTLIAVMLIKYMLAIENEKSKSNKDYKKKITFFLVDRVHLVFQQANVIRANCDARIKELCGDMNVDSWKEATWIDIWDNNDICVLTAQIFLDNLRSGFLTLDRVNLLIFDECHHASKGHPFNLIMVEFYHRIYNDSRNQALEKPKVFGMTASPIHKSTKKVVESISILETSLESLVYTARSSEELKEAVKKPFEIELFYSMPVIDDIPPMEYSTTINCKRVERYPKSILTTLISGKIEPVPGAMQCLNAVTYISNNLGPWCADRLWKSILQKAAVNGLFTPTLYDPERKLTTYHKGLLKEAYDMSSFATPTDPNIRNERLFTPKAKTLIDCLQEILANDANKKDFCGIVFVERRHTAVAIKTLVESLSIFRNDIRCDVLIGHGTKGGGDLQMKYTKQNEVIARFRSGELNLMVATNVAEEGLDIQACNYVIRFDPFKTVIAYIQSRGRARRKDSRYILMLNDQNSKDVNLLQNVVATEYKMKEYCRLLPKDRNLALLYDQSPHPGAYEPEYIKQSLSNIYLDGAFCIESTGALLTKSNAIALVYHYCATLPADNFCNSKPVYKFDDITNEDLSSEERKALDLHIMAARSGKIHRCTLTLPINARIQQFVSYDCTKDDAKARVSLQACIALYKAGDIDDHLVPRSKTQRKVLMELVESDENGKQIGSRGRENFYKKRQPSFWKGGSNGDDTTAVHLGPYWPSLFAFEEPHGRQPNVPAFRPMCLITKKPLPPIPEITLFNDNTPFKVHVKSQYQAFSFSKQQQIDDLKDYSFAFLKCLTNKDFKCSGNDIEYFIAPLLADHDYLPTADSSSKIDWAEISKTVANANLAVDVLGGIADAIVVEVNDQKRRLYFVRQVQHDMTPMSRVPACISTHKDGKTKTLREREYETFAEYYENQELLVKKVTDMGQALLRVDRLQKNQSFLYINASKATKKKDQEPEFAAAWLVPEICQLFPISASVYQTLQIIPDVMTRIDAALLLQDAKKSLGLSDRIQDVLLLEAFTTSSAALDKNYQRLEFLGDSALKFISSTYVFVSLPLGNEYELSESRMHMISNNALFKSAENLHLAGYICSQNLPRRLWRPPNYTWKDDSAEMIEALTTHKLSDKTLADVIESTLGASYLSSSQLHDALHTAKQLLVPLQKIEQWSDFYKVYQDERRLHKIKAAVYDSSLDQPIDVHKVSHILGYQFHNESLVAEALTHASLPFSSVPCYQRLEFLGDAVLDFCVTNYLFKKYQKEPPGILHSLRKSCVNNDILSVLCVQLELNVHIRHFSSTFPSAVEQFQQLVLESRHKQGEYWLNFNPPKILSDVVESLIGAVFVDSEFNLAPVEKLFDKLLRPLLDEHISISTIQEHPSSKLKCMVQEFGCKQCETRNVYTKEQHCVVFIHGEAYASGSGVNTKEAKKKAATNACQRIEDLPDEFMARCTC
ncbi:putative dicer-like protein [Parasitella parasitica]|nr:putative dicer-like protein [Parasitella parasitica]